MVKIDTLFQTKRAKKNPTLWRRTYLYNLYKGVPPPGLHFTLTENSEVLAIVDGENSAVVHPITKYH